MLISLENISKDYSGEAVLRNVALTVEDGDRIGLIGINGCGKSTLLRIIADKEAPDTQGEPHVPQINRHKTLRIGYLEQQAHDTGLTIIDEMRSAFSEVLAAAARIKELQAANLIEQHREEYSRLTAFFEANDGYLIDIKINKVLRGMGFAADMYDRAVSTLSGGERTRLALAKLLLEEPDLLILDEPTNHLDFDTVIWLEDYLATYKKALLIVSHDRYFLDKLVTSVCEIERGTLRRFKGNYTAFVRQKSEWLTHRLKEYEANLAEIARLKDYVARNIVRASTSNMAKSRAKQLEKLQAELGDKPVTSEKSARIRLQYDREPPKEVLRVDRLQLAVGEGSSRRVLVEDLTFDVRRGERLAVVGVNGIGKSTLLKRLLRNAGDDPLQPAVGSLGEKTQNASPTELGASNPSSRVTWAENVKLAYFEQTNTELFDPQDTALNAAHKLYPRMTELEVRSLLGSVRLTGDDVYKKVESLSGGERSKLRFAVMTLERGNVLVLDEPTNHLDITTRDVLETALFGYSGTIIFVSHDRYLLDRLATRVLEMTPHGVNSYKGGFAEFLEHRRRSQSAVAVEDKTAEIKHDKLTVQEHGSYRTKEQRAAETQRRVRIKHLESEIERLEALVAEFERELETPEVYTNHELLQEKCDELAVVRDELTAVSDEWLELVE